MSVDRPLSSGHGSLLEADARLKSGRTGVVWRPAFAWGKDTERMLKEKLAGLPRPILHLGSGSSRVGDVRLDAFHPGADLKGDAERTPFKDAVAGTVCMDPPFTEAHLLKRQAWATEAVRLLRVGGVLVLHAPWMLKRPTLELVEVHVRDDSTFNMLPGPPICLSIYRKLRDGARRSSA